MIEIDGVKEALWATRHPDASYFASTYEGFIAYATAPSVTWEDTNWFDRARADLLEHDYLVRALLRHGGVEAIYDDVMAQVDSCVMDRHLQTQNAQLFLGQTTLA